ncbi:hypothetical protein KKF38_00075 [Patescibacteria group bacterium]|nr:hypothetical protein [Patescibacteria group bacterium]
MNSKINITSLVLPAVLQKVWRRGEDYFKSKRVRNLIETENEIIAEVIGTQSYRVRFFFVRGQIDYECGCPHFARCDEVCKHIVAVALTRDKNKNLPLPTSADVEKSAAIDAGELIKRMYDDPLNVNLDHLREAADWGSWVRSHARLPKRPAMSADVSTPLTFREVETVFKRLEKWTDRRNYDVYFCAGEMAAGFCEVLDMIRGRASITTSAAMLEILLLCAKKADEFVLGWIDDSDGLHVFLIARLKRMIQELEARVDDIVAWNDFCRQIEKLELGGDYF